MMLEGCQILGGPKSLARLAPHGLSDLPATVSSRWFHPVIAGWLAFEASVTVLKLQHALCGWAGLR